MSPSFNLVTGLLLGDHFLKIRKPKRFKYSDKGKANSKMSANYSTESLKLKLGKMNGTQESIQVTSYWFLFHIKHANESVKTWAENVCFKAVNCCCLFLSLP